jgi:hypothetical protein
VNAYRSAKQNAGSGSAQSDLTATGFCIQPNTKDKFGRIVLYSASSWANSPKDLSSTIFVATENVSTRATYEKQHNEKTPFVESGQQQKNTHKLNASKVIHLTNKTHTSPPNAERAIVANAQQNFQHCDAGANGELVNVPVGAFHTQEACVSPATCIGIGVGDY